MGMVKKDRGERERAWAILMIVIRKRTRCCVHTVGVAWRGWGVAGPSVGTHRDGSPSHGGCEELLLLLLLGLLILHLHCSWARLLIHVAARRRERLGLLHRGSARRHCVREEIGG